MIIIIMITEFINREAELKSLEERYKKNSFEFIPIYGRRRVGKTELILQFIKNKKSIYFLATAGTKRENIERFKVASSHLIDLSSIKEDWEAIFEYLKNHIKERAIIVIDEFPYLIETEKGLSSIFQAIVDLHLKDSKTFLILSGSSLSMMYKEVLTYRAPLYGRRTGQIHLKQLRFKDVVKFFNKPLEEIIKIYSVCGGVPAYLNEFRENKNLFSLIKEKILNKNSILKEEVPFLLRQEFRNPKVYMAIISAMAMGYRNLGKIINYCGFESKTGIMPYLNSLEYLDYIRREIPITEKQRSKKGLYFISDNFFGFWFRFVRANQSIIEQDVNKGLEKIKKDFISHVSFVFEYVCKEFLWETKLKRKVFDFEKIGRWWYKDKEIDIVALNEKTREILFTECKWKDKVNAEKVLRELKEKSKYVQWHNDNRKESFAIFAKSFKRKIKEKNVFLFDLKDLEKKLK